MVGEVCEDTFGNLVRRTLFNCFFSKEEFQTIHTYRIDRDVLDDGGSGEGPREVMDGGIVAKGLVSLFLGVCMFDQTEINHNQLF